MYCIRVIVFIYMTKLPKGHFQEADLVINVDRYISITLSYIGKFLR